MHAEITDNKDGYHPRGWVLYDGECPLCINLARRFAPLLGRHRFALAPLQTPWVQARLGLKPGEALTEMRLLTPDGRVRGGADAILQVARCIWWAWPFYVLAQIPGVKPLLRWGYRHVANHRSCADGVCNRPQPWRWPAYVPLLALPAVALLFGAGLPAWGFMWTLALAIGAGCKWLTWWLARSKVGQVSLARTLGYLLLWPGMDARAFLDAKRNLRESMSIGKKKFDLASDSACCGSQTRAPERASARRSNSNHIGDSEVTFGDHLSSRACLPVALKIFIGIALVWGGTRLAVGEVPLVAAWIGAIGLCVLLHFGSFHLLALAWQKAGVDAKPLMHAPILSTSLSEFWSKRWNAAFNALAFEFVFRPLARNIGTVGATLAAFLASGLVHDLVISVPAQGGCGLPTAYFLFQGIGVSIERSAVGKRLGLGCGWRGWLFTFACTTGPAFWLFHPPFMKRVMLPFLNAIGAF